MSNSAFKKWLEAQTFGAPKPHTATGAMAIVSKSYSTLPGGGTHAVSALFIGGSLDGQTRRVSLDGSLPTTVLVPVVHYHGLSARSMFSYLPDVDLTYEQETYVWDVSRYAYVLDGLAPPEPEPLLPDPEYRKRLEAESGF